MADPKSQQADKKNKNPFQDTLNLPRTDFSIRANAQEKEPAIIQKWKEQNLFEHATHLNEGNEAFILHDGPPYANGHIHMGTAFNKILKDIVCKSKRMSGKYVPVTPGWDCHGLPIELKALAELGLDGTNITDRVTLKSVCRTYASKWIDIQREEFKNIGVIMDWDKPYITMDPSYEASIIRSLAVFAEKGYIERKGKTVPWCFSCKTVLATAEIEYHDRKDPSLYVLFPLEQREAKLQFPFLYEQKPDLEISFLIWTTTPWTIPLNRAVVLNPSATYVVLQGKEVNQAFIVAKDMSDKICKEIGIEKAELCEFDALIFQGKRVTHPTIDRFMVPIILDEMVLVGEGTGCLHSAPGCGPEDYLLGIKNNLEIFSPLSADGTYSKGIEPSELEGMSIVDGQIWVIKNLAASGRLFHKTSVKHSYPHCWRCRNGLMFRATDQWFCDLRKNDLVGRTLDAIDSITFMPPWGQARLRAFIENRAEWCISRQRQWGVPITALICNSCEQTYLNQKFINKIADHVEEEGIEFWDRMTVETLKSMGILAHDFACSGCKGSTFRLERDILDVWFDSGISHYAVLDHDSRYHVPANMYLEGSDQHRGWFQSSLLTSMVLHGKAQTKAILTHGYVVDKDKRKMSKSLGNVIAPQQIIDQYSRDILRLWVASADYESDIVISEKALQNVAEMYRKIRNTSRFLLSNLYDFDIHKDALDVKNLMYIDAYILSQLHELNENIREWYETYNYTAVIQALNNFCVNNLSALYLDISKDRLYCERPKSKARRSAQTATYHILDTLTHLMAPILSFLAEEVSDHYMSDKTQSIHLKNFASTLYTDEVFVKTYQKSMPLHLVSDLANVMLPLRVQAHWIILEEVRDAVLKGIEKLREQGIVKHSLEAAVTVYIDKNHEQGQTLIDFINDVTLSEDVVRFFKDWFIVSQFELVQSEEGLLETNVPWLFIGVDHAKGVKCPRCWQWDTVGTAGIEPDESSSPELSLCSRCKEVLK